MTREQRTPSKELEGLLARRVSNNRLVIKTGAEEGDGDSWGVNCGEESDTLGKKLKKMERKWKLTKKEKMEMLIGRWSFE